MTIEAPQIPTMGKSAVRNGAVSFLNKLDTGELLTGTPTVTEIATSDLTFANVAVSTGSLTINGDVVATGQAVQFKVSGGTPGRIYRLRVSCGTDSSPAQTLVVLARLRVQADGT